MTTIKINPTVKSQIESTFGINSLSLLLINTYEAVYNMAFADGSSLEEGHKIAMDSLLELSKMLK